MSQQRIEQLCAERPDGKNHTEQKKFSCNKKGDNDADIEAIDK